MFFSRNISTAASELAEEGYVNLKGAASSELVAYLENFYETRVTEPGSDLKKGKITGKKKQYLFDFADLKMSDDFRNQICQLLNYDPARLTISERHIKAYDENAARYPAPHKDRSASTFSIGIPIKLCESTSVCIFPNLDRSANDEEHAAFLKGKTPKEIEALYALPETVHLNEQVGDIVVFEGSALFHERSNPAESVVLYIKVNNQGLDPLNENIFEAV